MPIPAPPWREGALVSSNRPKHQTAERRQRPHDDFLPDSGVPMTQKFRLDLPPLSPLPSPAHSVTVVTRQSPFPVCFSLLSFHIAQWSAALLIPSPSSLHNVTPSGIVCPSTKKQKSSPLVGFPSSYMQRNLLTRNQPARSLVGLERGNSTAFA